ncbi:hypothetical protein ACFLSJ_06360 [Verrucomicrobiota bacterium]
MGLYYAWTPDIVSSPFGDWLVVDHTEDTGGWLFAGDLYVDGNDDVHVLYHRAPIGLQLRDGHFPDIPRTFALCYARLRGGELLMKTALAEGGEGTGTDVVPYDLSGEDATIEWQGQRINPSRVGTPRFWIAPDERLFALYYTSGTDREGCPVSENRLTEIRHDGTAGTTERVPLDNPLSQFFTATERAGSKVSDVVDMLGYRAGEYTPLSDKPLAVSYARLRITTGG